MLEVDIWIWHPDIWRSVGQWLAKRPRSLGPTAAGPSWDHAAGQERVDFAAGLLPSLFFRFFVLS